jgi:hypothetical protein
MRLRLRYLESPLELLELGGGEGGSDPPLLPLLCEDTLVPRVHLIWQT